MKVRQDAWSHEDDLLLAETVLRHIREGSTQLNAFEEVGDKLNRTSAACGFRWNAEVRKKYHQAMELAKKQRKERKRALARQAQQQQHLLQEPFTVNLDDDSLNSSDAIPPTTDNHPTAYEQAPALTRQIETQVELAAELNLDSVISYLRSLRNTSVNSQILQSENERLTRENQQLVSEKEKLERKLQRVRQENIIIHEDYQALVQIMDRARRMVSYNEEVDSNPSLYANDTNEDIGQIAK